jgi:glycosyltransferase involved in cell wall biosynthesis
MTMAQVSVVIPTYNRAALVLEAVGSVLAQTVQDVEVIVVDDGSTDNTRQRIAAVNDTRVCYVYQSNAGCAAACNAGLARCRGRYVAFLDSDDLWPEHFLQIMVRRLQAHPQAGCAYCSVVKTFPDGHTEPSYGSADCRSGWITAALFGRGFIWLSGALFRAAVWQDFFFDEALSCSGEDSDAVLRLSVRVPYLYVDEVTVVHRMTEDSVSRRQGVNPNRLLSVERFYYDLGGRDIIPRPAARRRLSHACRRLAEDYRRRGCRRAARAFYVRALRYWPFDMRLYVGWCRSGWLRHDVQPAWRKPAALPAPRRYLGQEPTTEPADGEGTG